MLAATKMAASAKATISAVAMPPTKSATPNTNPSQEKAIKAFARAQGDRRSIAHLSKMARLLLRSELSVDEKNAILSLEGNLIRLGAHRDVVRPGEKSNFACMVVGGLAGRFDQLANGERQVTALHIPGDMCDQHSVAVDFRTPPAE